MFWPYAGIVYLAVQVISTIPMMMILAPTMARMHAYALAHPETSSVSVGPGSYHVQVRDPPPELMPDFGSVAPWGIGVTAVLALFLGAAIVRRLHDRGLTGFIALLPLPFSAFSLFMMPRVFRTWATSDPDYPAFFAVLVSNLLHLAALGVVLLLCALPSKAGPNRFGPAPLTEGS